MDSFPEKALLIKIKQQISDLFASHGGGQRGSFSNLFFLFQMA